MVTADHGEMLGEGGRYIHGGNPTNQLCKLPWYNVDKNMIGTSKDESIETVDRRDVDFTNQDVKKQLEDLGYL